MQLDALIMNCAMTFCLFLHSDSLFFQADDVATAHAVRGNEK